MAQILQPFRSVRGSRICWQWCQVPGDGFGRWWQWRRDGRRRPALEPRTGGGRMRSPLPAWRVRRRRRASGRWTWKPRRRNTRRSRCRMRTGTSGRSRRRRGGRHVGLWARGRRAWSSWFYRCRGRPRRSGSRRRCGSCRRHDVGPRRRCRPMCRGRWGRMPGRCRRRSLGGSSGRHGPRSRPRRRSGRLSRRRMPRESFCRRLRLPSRVGFHPLLRLRYDQRRALGVCWEACKLHRRQGGRGKQHETKSGHLIFDSPSGQKRCGGINKYRLGRNVAAFADEPRCISPH